MIPEFINHTSSRIPRQYLICFLAIVIKDLKRQKKWATGLNSKSLQLVFLPRLQAKSLNHQFRGKNYATDVLSFDSTDPDSMGELVFCPEVLKKQAREHGLTFRDELCYMTLHGLLHLLGYDHEISEKQAKIMFQLQDSIFENALSGTRS